MNLDPYNLDPFNRRLLSISDSSSIPEFRSDRPIGVTILVVLQFLAIGILTILLLAVWADPEVRQAVPVWEQLFFVGTILLAVVMAVGLWYLREWSRLLTVFLFGLALCIDIISIFATTLTGSDLISLAIQGAIIFYLTRPNVRECFY